MKKFRVKVPKGIVQAIQLKRETRNEICKFMGCTHPKEVVGASIGLLIPTCEGFPQVINENDWVVRDDKGKFFRCNPETFEAIYEEVN